MVKKMTIEKTSEKLSGKRDPYEWAKKYLKEVPKEIISLDKKRKLFEQNIELQKKQEEFEKTNLYRKQEGLDVDKDLEPISCDICGKKTLELKMIPMDLGKGLQYIYHCDPCLLGKTPKKDEV